MVNFTAVMSFCFVFFLVCVRLEPSGERAGGGRPQSSGYHDSEAAAGTRPKTGNK